MAGPAFWYHDYFTFDETFKEAWRLRCDLNPEEPQGSEKVEWQGSAYRLRVMPDEAGRLERETLCRTVRILTQSMPFLRVEPERRAG